jgi:pimeloyl-ACP methyl ester carboxylesterase
VLAVVVLTPTAANVGRYTAAGLPPHVIAGSGHSPMVEKPGEFVAAIRQFVGGAGGAVTSPVRQ